MTSVQESNTRVGIKLKCLFVVYRITHTPQVMMYYKMLLFMALNLSLFYLCGSVASFKSSSSPYSPSGRYSKNILCCLLTLRIQRIDPNENETKVNNTKMWNIYNISIVVEHFLVYNLTPNCMKYDIWYPHIFIKLQNICVES